MLKRDSVYAFILRRVIPSPTRPKLNRARVVGSGTEVLWRQYELKVCVPKPALYLDTMKRP